MNQKDFELIAAILAADRPDSVGQDYGKLSRWEQGTSDEWHTVQLAFEDRLRREFPEFNPALFNRACYAPH